MSTSLPETRLGLLLRIRWAVRAAQVRLRFLAALAIILVVVDRWDALRTHWDRWTAPAPRDAAMGAVSADTEYFCPMDPGVLSDWPGKCPVCFMALVRRKKGDMSPTPASVLARVQLSPERIMLAGLATEPVADRPLARDIRLLGSFEGKAFLAEVGRDEAGWISPGLDAEIMADPPDGNPAVAGKVEKVEAGVVKILVSGTPPGGRFAGANLHPKLADREPFRSMPHGEPSLRPDEPRAIFFCHEHPDILRTEAGQCPRDKANLERLPLARNQRVSWWCPMHPGVKADRPDSRCDACGGMVLVPRVVRYSPAGHVPSIPASALIDTGTKTVAYVERMPGMFDGVEVKVGPRCGAYYPVVEGLQVGQSVAASGAFLVDAETRLNPSLAAAYFGASRAESAASAPATTQTAAKALDFSGLNPADRAAAQAQAACPVTGKPLGSMGSPPAVVVKGRRVFLCCEGCRGAVEGSPDTYLAKLKAPAPAVGPHHP